MFKVPVIFFLILFCSTASAQITGKLSDTTAGTIIQNAVVAIIRPSDSVLVAFTRTDANGQYSIPAPAKGTYTLMVMHPQFADFVDVIDISKAQTKMPGISLTSKAKLMQEIVISSASAIKVKGDTTSFLADSFKVSANANVEELLKKLPGLQVDKDGKITAMGKTVEKVLVDGEEFFGNDPGMAVKNLRADAVKEVQVFDKKSEQAEFTGIDDGNTQKTINLKLKDNAKHGYFGKVDLSGGLMKDIDDRYNNNVLFSTFKGKRKLSAFVLNGNTGQDGLSWQDQDKYGGSNNNVTMDDDGNTYWTSGGSSDGEPYINTNEGFIRNLNAGMSYSNKWNDKQTLNFSPQYNSQIYDNNTKQYTQIQLSQDSVLNINALSGIHVNRSNEKFGGNYEIKIDSNNTIKLTGKANFYNTESTTSTNSVTTGKNGNLKNGSDRFLNTELEKQAYGGTILYKHKFNKARRTFSVQGNFDILNSDGVNNLITNNIDYSTNTPLNVNQQFLNNKNSTTASSTVVYTEPLGKKYAVELNHTFILTNGQNDQQAYSFTTSTGKYETAVDSLTNNFEQKILENRPGAKLSYSYKKLKWNVGSAFGITDFNFTDITFNKAYDRRFTNIFPTASISFTAKGNKNINLRYNGRTTQPTLNQLQPLRNNNDQFNLYIGNPNLKQSFTNNVNLSYNSYDFLKGTYMYGSLNGNFYQNAIIEKTTVSAASGKTVRQPVNVDGNYNINFWSGIGFKDKKLDTRFNINPSISYNKRAVILNEIQGYSTTFSPAMNIYINKTKEKKYDLTLSSNFSKSYNKNGQNNDKTSFYTNDIGFNGKIYYKKVWSVETDYNFSSRKNTAQGGTDLSFHIINARLQRTFKKDEYTVYFTLRDILNQNTGIDQYIDGNYYYQTVNDRLKRYFLVGLRWDFKNKTQNKPADNNAAAQ